MDIPSPERRLVRHVHDLRFADLPPEAVANATTSVLDTVGVALAAAGSAPGRLVVGHVERIGGHGPASVIGHDLRTAPELAALANGVLAHALDFDERGHAGTHLLGPVLAMAQDRGAGGADLLVAYVAGREVRAHLGEQFDRGRQLGRGAGARGWHSTGVLGVLAAAMAAGKVMGLDPDRLGHALGIAASAAGGLNRNWGSMTKPMHAGRAARDGVQAAQLAEAGFTSSADALSGPRGFVDAFCGRDEFDLDRAVTDLTERLLVAERPVRVKPYPTCTGTHPYIEAAREVRTALARAPGAIDSVECTATPSVDRPTPRTDLECRFSVQFCIAVTLLDGGVTLDNCTPRFLARPDVVDLVGRVRCTSRALDIARPDGRNVLRVRLVDGRELVVPVPGIRDLTTDEETRAKFRDCAERTLGRNGAARAEDLLLNLPELRSVDELADALAVPEPIGARR